MCAEVSGAGEELELASNRHAKFLLRTLQVLPTALSSFDTQRVTISYFAIAGLDVLQRLDLLQEDRANIIDWLYSCLIQPASRGETGERRDDDAVCSVSGFRGSPALKLCRSTLPGHAHDHGHIAMTYTALASLLTLGDDLGRLDRAAILRGVRALQLKDGSFQAALQGGENDMRFLYCAAAICSILGDWSGMDRDLALGYITTSISYEGGIGQGPGLEAHGGSTYCGVAALSLMGCLPSLPAHTRQGIVRWCVARQGRGSDRAGGAGAGFQGRPNKPEDTCYSFWVGATLALLDSLHLTSAPHSQQFVLSTQDPVTGGLAKWIESSPDPLHTYLGLSGLSLAGHTALSPVHPALNITARTKAFLDQLHQDW